MWSVKSIVKNLFATAVLFFLGCAFVGGIRVDISMGMYENVGSQCALDAVRQPPLTGWAITPLGNDMLKCAQGLVMPSRLALAAGHRH
jgi:hypothetical protein